MSRLLYIESSPRKKRSASIEVAHTFLETFAKAHPHEQVEMLDLWKKEIPRFDGDVIDSKYAILHGQSHTEAQRKAWHAVEQMITEFKQADKYLISVPMWNFGIPYILKHYIDVLLQPSYTFSFSPEEGYKGLVNGKPVVVIYARGGSYGPGSGGEALDFQKTYMESVLKFIGFTDIKSIIVEPTLGKPEDKEKAIESAKKQAQQFAEKF